MRQIFVISALLSISLFLGCRHGQPTDSYHRSAKFQVTIENVSMAYTYTGSGFFNTPVGAPGPAPIGPGESYEFMFDAAPGSRLSLATMFVHSNDFFYAPGAMGIELFNGTTQVTGDVTSQIMLWDAGTEINQEPGVGADQAPHQMGPNTGAPDPDNTVRMAMDTYGNLPAVTDVIKVTLASTSPTGFKATIMNVSNASTLNSSMGIIGAVPLAPGVFVVHSGDNPLFTDGQPDAGKGLEGLAEDGDPGVLHAYLDMHSGITHILAPGVWTVHKENNILFTPNEQDMGEGLEALAEDGDPGMLSANIGGKDGFKSGEIFNTPLGSGSPGPLTPGGSYQFTFTAKKGDMLSFATMFVQSNDLFYAPNGEGIELFNGRTPVIGDLTDMIYLWDAGTEVNEKPGFGLNQAPRQSGPNTGTTENGMVEMVNDGFQYPDVWDVIKVSINIVEED